MHRYQRPPKTIALTERNTQKFFGNRVQQSKNGPNEARKQATYILICDQSVKPIPYFYFNAKVKITSIQQGFATLQTLASVSVNVV